MTIFIQRNINTISLAVLNCFRVEQLRQWQQEHPRYNRADPFHLLPRREQVVIFRLRTGHNRLNHHLYTKFRIGQTEQCPCMTGSHTIEHMLQSCPLHEALRQRIWPDHKAMAQKLYGGLEDLQRTVTFIVETGLSFWQTRRRNKKQISKLEIFMKVFFWIPFLNSLKTQVNLWNCNSKNLKKSKLVVPCIFFCYVTCWWMLEHGYCNIKKTFYNMSASVETRETCKLV